MRLKVKWWHVALLLSVLVALLSPLASGSPDGLEKVAEDKGFIKQAKNPPFELIADYVFPGVENEAAATILAGIVGTLLIFGLTYGVARLLRAKRSRDQERSPVRESRPPLSSG
ncbi:MAG: hypothetical protein FJ012_08390 [Chloroflexi bacterium]|nr:hypothetical protein [Chloroflexota bacterium]